EIKPGFFKNEELGEIEPLARLFFAGLWCWADRMGRFEDRPKKLKADILPYDNCDGENLMRQLEEHGFVIRYEVNGKRYGQIVNWKKHQSPHPAEAVSNIPAPDQQPESNLQVSCNEVTDNLKATENNLQATDEQPDKNPIPSFTSIPSLDDDNARAEIIAQIQKIKPISDGKDGDFVNDLIDNYPRDWLLEAIKKAIGQKARSFEYVDTIVANWRAKGYVNSDKPWEVAKIGKDYKSRNSSTGKQNKRSGRRSSEKPAVDWENEPDTL
ncbi:MAG: DnaD domain protein, partial [Sporomusa sp.]